MATRILTAASLAAVILVLVSSMGWAAQDPPTVTPPGGYSGFPTLAADDGRFVAIAQGLSTLGVPAVSGLNFSVCVPDTETNLDLWVFDGNTTNTISTGSFWDLTRLPQTNNDAFEYNLYPDKDLVGNLTGSLENVDASTLADNDWDNFITRTLDAAALDAANNRYCYHLEAVYMAPSGLNQANRIKLASNGSIFLLPGSTAGFVGLGDIDPIPDLFPGRDTTYDGTFDFNVNVPASGTACSLSIWDGDTDMAADVDDANSPNSVASLPFDTSPNTLDEGANEGDPPDDPAVPITNTTFAGTPTITITGPGNSYVYSNTNPSGNQEWERNKIISLDAECPAPPGDEDQQVASIDPGNHLVEFANLDGENMIFLATEDADIIADACSLDVTKLCQIEIPCEDSCPDGGGGDDITLAGGDDGGRCCPGGGDDITLAGDDDGCGDDITLAGGDDGEPKVCFSEPSDTCSYIPPDGPHCIGKVATVVLTYVGGDCSGSNNDQGDAASCAGGDPGASDVAVTTPEGYDVFVSGGGLLEQGSFIIFSDNGEGGGCCPGGGDDITLAGGDDGCEDGITLAGGDDGGGCCPGGGDDITLASGDDGECCNPLSFILEGDANQELSFETCCENPLNLGDRFGALEVTTILLEDGTVFSTATLADYIYEVTNNNAFPVTDISLSDDKLGLIADGFDLEPGVSMQFFDTALLLETTTNVATATGTPAGGGICEGDASATVTVFPPFQCSQDVTALRLMFDNGGIEGDIRIKAYDGDPGDTLLAEIPGIEHGDIITVSGYTGNENTVEFEIFIDSISTEEPIAASEFRIDCSDTEMNGPEDCGKFNGDGPNDTPGLVNLWRFMGLTDSDETFECPAP